MLIKRLALVSTLLSGIAGSAVALAQPPHERLGAIAALEQLDLSDAQWLQIHKLMQQHRTASRPLHQRERRLHMELATLDATSPGYAQQLQKLQDEAAQLARDRVQDAASIKGQIGAVLTEQQRAQLAQRFKGREHPGFAPAD